MHIFVLSSLHLPNLVFYLFSNHFLLISCSAQHFQFSRFRHALKHSIGRMCCTPWCVLRTMHATSVVPANENHVGLSAYSPHRCGILAVFFMTFGVFALVVALQWCVKIGANNNRLLRRISLWGGECFMCSGLFCCHCYDLMQFGPFEMLGFGISSDGVLFMDSEAIAFNNASFRVVFIAFAVALRTQFCVSFVLKAFSFD